MEKERRIQSVSLYFPNSDCGEVIFYLVGKKTVDTGYEVTEIKRVSKPTEFTPVDYFEIWSGDKLLVEMHQYGHIQYFVEDNQ